MQRLEVIGAVRPLLGSLGVKGLIYFVRHPKELLIPADLHFSPFVHNAHIFPKKKDSYFRSIRFNDLNSVEPDTLTKLLKVPC